MCPALVGNFVCSLNMCTNASLITGEKYVFSECTLQMNRTVDLADCVGSTGATPTGQENITMEIRSDCSMTRPEVASSISTLVDEIVLAYVTYWTNKVLALDTTTPPGDFHTKI